LQRESGIMLACCTLVSSIVFFAVNGLAHWAAPAYFSAIVSGGVLLAHLLRRATMRRTAALVVFCGVMVVCTAGESAYVVRAVIVGAPMPGPIGQMVEPTLIVPALHWPEVGNTIATVVHHQEPSSRHSTMLLADTYGTAAEVAFYTSGHPHVYSGSNQYSIWGVPDTVHGPLLFVGNAGILTHTAAARQGDSHLAAAVTIRSPEHVIVRKLDVSVLPASTPVAQGRSATSLQQLLASVWHAAATRCEGS
jgi:hypothetical protein